MRNARSNPRTVSRSLAAAPALAAACVLFVGCSGGTKDVRMRIVGSDDGAPVRGAHVRAVALGAGMVPLPLDERTIPELLALSGSRSGAFSNANGDVRLRLTPGRAHLVEVEPPPFVDDAGALPGEWWLLDAGGAAIVRIERDRLDAAPHTRFDVRINP